MGSGPLQESRSFLVDRCMWICQRSPVLRFWKPVIGLLFCCIQRIDLSCVQPFLAVVQFLGDSEIRIWTFGPERYGPGEQGLEVLKTCHRSPVLSHSTYWLVLRTILLGCAPYSLLGASKLIALYHSRKRLLQNLRLWIWHWCVKPFHLIGNTVWRILAIIHGPSREEKANMI